MEGEEATLRWAGAGMRERHARHHLWLSHGGEVGFVASGFGPASVLGAFTPSLCRATHCHASVDLRKNHVEAKGW